MAGGYSLPYNNSENAITGVLLSPLIKKASDGQIRAIPSCEKGEIRPFAVEGSLAFRARIDGVAPDSYAFGLTVCLDAPVLTLDATECLCGRPFCHDTPPGFLFLI